MTHPDKTCPVCGAALPEEASFCPHCARDLRPRQTPAVPVCRRWPRRLKWAILLAALALLLAALYTSFAPQVYEGRGEVLYEADNGNTYRLFLTFHSGTVPEEEYTVPLEAQGNYARYSRLFITHADTGQDAGQFFNQQKKSTQVRILQPADSPSPVVCHAPVTPGNPADGLLFSQIGFTGQSRGPVEVEWTINLKNGDTIVLRQTLIFEMVDTLHCYPEDYDMDTIEDLQALVDRLQDEVPPSAAIHLHLPPVHYEGGLTIGKRTIHLSGSVDEKQMRTAFLGPVVIAPEKGPMGRVENIDFLGNGAGTGLTVTANYRVENCAFLGWDTGLLAGGAGWTVPVGCWFEDNGTGFRFHTPGAQAVPTDFYGNTFLHNNTAVDLAQIPGSETLSFNDCRFAENDMNVVNSTEHPVDLSNALFQ